VDLIWSEDFEINVSDPILHGPFPTQASTDCYPVTVDVDFPPSKVFAFCTISKYGLLTAEGNVGWGLLDTGIFSYQQSHEAGRGGCFGEGGDGSFHASGVIQITFYHQISGDWGVLLESAFRLSRTWQSRSLADASARGHARRRVGRELPTTRSAKLKPVAVKVCVLYDPRSGSIAHVHKVVTLQGTSKPSEKEVERRAFERARALGTKANVLNALHVKPEDWDDASFFRVDPPSRSLAKIQMKKRGRPSRALPRSSGVATITRKD
jgi:hypothetical protein